MAKQFEASYTFSCRHCGNETEFQHKEPGEGDVILTVQSCSLCGQSHFLTIPGAKAYKLRSDTLRLQMDILKVFADVGPPMTVRQVYYRLTTFGAVAKTENGYNRVQNQLTKMRRAGSIPYNWLSDNTRRRMQATQYNGLGDALDYWQGTYRRDLWLSQSAHVEIWIEKDALAGQLWPIASEFGVPLYVSRGYSSLSFVYEAAEQLRDLDRDVFIYYLGDYDADGMYACESLQKELTTHGAIFHFERLSITPKQIETYGLGDALRPQKRSSTRYKWWKQTTGNAMCCELDALHPQILRELVHNAITRHIDPYEWQRVQEIEQAERDTLQTVLSSLRGG